MLMTQTQEGRDKFIKFLQYLAKYLSWYYGRPAKPANKGAKSLPVSAESLEIASAYYNLSVHLYNARSIFRLLKSLIEVKRISIILRTIKETDRFTLITNVSSRACYFFFWLFDNLYILTKIMLCPQ
mmetsp:Transcript_29242/g.44059  ORF Transcript_29242/g.44059 Transcript_29242/m.44059 type:complete len:127 (+) Transcript_29242:486-866(+)